MLLVRRSCAVMRDRALRHTLSHAILKGTRLHQQSSDDNEPGFGGVERPAGGQRLKNQLRHVCEASWAARAALFLFRAADANEGRFRTIRSSPLGRLGRRAASGFITRSVIGSPPDQTVDILCD